MATPSVNFPLMETGAEAGQHGAEEFPDTPDAGDEGHGTERAVKKVWRTHLRFET